MALTVRSKINAALGVGLALVVLFGAGAYVTIQSFLTEARHERESQEATFLLERAVSRLKTAESWQRKYLITQSDSDLANYEAAREETRKALAEARRAEAAKDDEHLFESLKASIDSRLAFMDDTVRTRTQQGLPAAGARVGSSAATQLRQKIDRLVDRINEGEGSTRVQLRSDNSASAVAIQQFILAGGLVSVLLLAWVIYLVNAYATRRVAADAKLAHSHAELRRVGQALRASEAQMREVIDAVPALVAYIDVRQRLLFHNRAYSESLGASSEAIAGSHVRDVLGPALYEAIAPHLQEGFRGRPVTYRRTQRDSQGIAREFELRYIPRLGAGRHEDEVLGVYVLGIDVTELERVERMKSEFVATVSHELRTPLTSIRGSLGLLGGGVAGALPPRAAALVKIANENCERLVRLVGDILDIEKLDSAHARFDLQSQPLAPLLAQAVAINEGFARQHEVKLVLDAGEAEVCALVDADRFLQVVTNLLANAVKFSPPGSNVDLRLRAAEGRARVEVRDRGPGVPAEFRQRIFERFSQADGSDARQASGTGLGLAISRAIVERMKGSIGFRDEAGGGTTFWFELPAAEPRPDPGTEAAVLPEASEGE